jgi:hypothetical protein
MQDSRCKENRTSAAVRTLNLREMKKRRPQAPYLSYCILNLEGDIDATAMRDTGIYATRQLAKHRDARCRIQDARKTGRAPQSAP